jgi:hypothetical protein
VTSSRVVLFAIRRGVARVSCVFAAVAVIAAPADAASTVPADCSSFGSALSNANDGDTIVLTGMCTGANAHFVLPLKAGLTIEGAATGTNGFDGTGLASLQAFASPPQGTDGLTLANLTFTNYASAGAVQISSPIGVGSSVTRPYVFDHDTFTNDSNTGTGTNGGALSVTLAPASCPVLTTPDVTFAGSTFTNDSAVGTDGNNGALDGGGGGAALDLECPQAAGISATVAITGNTFSGDTVSAPSGRSRQGGGLWIGVGRHQVAAQNMITQSVNVFDHDSITGTGGSYLGGGEYTAGDDITSDRDSFVANSIPGPSTSTLSSEGGGLATLGGGGCTLSAPTTSQFTNLVVTGNSIAAPTATGTGATVEGAGIYAGCNANGAGYHLTLTNATVSGNTASGTGAVTGVDGEATDSLVLQNSIVFGDSGGAEIGGFGAGVTSSFSDVCASGSTTTPFAGTGNICTDPTLADIGNGDLHETASSPTIDAGSNALVPTGVTSDFFGVPRILAGKFGDSPTVDIGAAEFAPPAPVNSGLPVISGTPVEGQTLSTTNGTWNGTTNAFAYQWQDCDSSGNACSNIGGAMGSTYVLGNADIGHELRVVVTATNAGGSASATSTSTPIVAAPAPPVPVLTRVHLTPSSFTAKKGTTVAFTLSTPASVTVVITQTVRGRKLNGRCRPIAKHGKRCTVTLKRTTRTLRGAAGANSIKLGLARLAPGVYHATISARNSGGTSRRFVLKFTIKPPAKRRHP